MEAGGNRVMEIYVCVRECTVYYMYFINEPACCTIGTTKKICALYTFSGYEYNYELGRFSSFLKAFFTELYQFLCVATIISMFLPHKIENLNNSNLTGWNFFGGVGGRGGSF